MSITPAWAIHFPFPPACAHAEALSNACTAHACRQVVVASILFCFTAMPAAQAPEVGDALGGTTDQS